MRVAAIACLLLAGCTARPNVQLRPLAQVMSGLQSSSPARLTDEGIELAVQQQAFVMFPFPGTTELVVECTSYSVFTVAYLSENGHSGPPARYQRMNPGTTMLFAKMLETEGWSSFSRPLLRFEGTGKVVMRRVASAAPPSSMTEATDKLDHALRFMPESVGHTTINTLTPPIISVQPERYLTDVAAIVAVIASVVLAFALRRHPRRWAWAALGGALTAFGIYDVHFLFVRYLPMVRPLRLDPEQRMAKDYYFAAELGELVKLARQTLPLAARVGVQGRADDWFGRQTLCFALQPRSCVMLSPNAHEHRGIGGWPLLKDEELDALVVFNPTEAIPAGFAPVAKISDNAYVARRR
jgi:hypothetical protein